MSFDPSRITDGFLFTWNIKNINVISDGKITSPVFIASNMENSEWNMEFSRRRLTLTRTDSKRKMAVPEIEVNLSAVSSNGSNRLFIETMYNKGFHWDLPINLLFCKTLTIHCHIRKAHEIVPLIQFSALTVIQAERRIGIWKVENFKLLTEDTPTIYVLESPGKQLPSIVFSGEKYNNIPNGRKIFLNLKEFGGWQLPSIPQLEKYRIKVTVPDFPCYKRIFLIGKISVLTKDGKIKCSKFGTFFFRCLSFLETFSYDHHSPFPFFTNLEIYFKVEDTDLNDGALFLICDFTISNGEGKNEVKESNYLPNEYKFLTNFQLSNDSTKEEKSSGVQNIPKAGMGQSSLDSKPDEKVQEPTETLEDDLNYEYLDKKYCNVVLSTAKKSFPVHKCILCLKSPVFKTMFETDMRETINKKVVIDDLDSDTLRRFLLFLYTKNLGNLHWEIAIKLYYAADKYQVTSLKSECSSFLKSYLSMSSVCEVLRLADLHQDEDLKLACKDFILKQNAAKIFSSEEWKAFTVSNPELSGEILQKYFLMKS